MTSMRRNPLSSPGRNSLRRARRGAPVAIASLALLLLAAPGHPASAQGRAVVGKIRGTVVDESRNPIAGLMVQLSSKDDNAVLRVTGTDEHGRYLFRDLPAGVYEITVGADGFEHESKSGIEVRPPFQNIVGFVLRPWGAAAADRSLTGSPFPARGAGADPAAADDPPAIDPAAAGSPSPGAGESGVVVRGRFTGEDRRGIPEVSVTFIGGDGGAYQGFSGDDGTFRLEGVLPGRYRVLVSSPGHVALDLPSVEVARPGGLNLSLSLVNHPLNSRERPGSAVLPPEKARPIPERTRDGEARERAPDGAGDDAASSGGDAGSSDPS